MYHFPDGSIGVLGCCGYELQCLCKTHTDRLLDLSTEPLHNYASGLHLAKHSTEYSVRNRLVSNLSLQPACASSDYGPIVNYHTSNTHNEHLKQCVFVLHRQGDKVFGHTYHSCTLPNITQRQTHSPLNARTHAHTHTLH